MRGDNHPRRKNPDLVLRGPKNGMYGRTHTPEVKQRLREAIKGARRRAKPMILVLPNGEEEWFEACVDACLKYNLSTSKISTVINGQNKHTKGYTARWA
jgi:hypothetical protein